MTSHPALTRRIPQRDNGVTEEDDMASTLLAAALIVKNEAENLPACLDALNELRPLMHEVCVYDTGSTDGTQELARAAGAVVQQGHWDGDFARARNEAIAMTSARWVLIVDADERVTADVPALRRAIRALQSKANGRIDALRVPCTNVEDNGLDGMLWGSDRILRTSRAHYVGAVHEQVMRRDGAPIVYEELSPRDLLIRHYGYHDETTLAGKLRRNLAIAEEEVAALAVGAAPDDIVRAYVDRARSRVGAGDIEGGLADMQVVHDTPSGATYRLHGLQQYAGWLIDLERVAEARALMPELASAPIHQSVTQWLEARCLFLEGHYAEALDLLRGIDKLVGATGTVDIPRPLVEARCRAAAVVGEHDEAAACAIRLIADLGVIEGYPRFLLTLWGAKPLDILAAILVEADRGYVRGALPAFRECPPRGAELADLLAAGLKA